jgi:hypothetical protein
LWLKGSNKLNRTSNYLIGNRKHDLPAFSIVYQSVRYSIPHVIDTRTCKNNLEYISFRPSSIFKLQSVINLRMYVLTLFMYRLNNQTYVNRVKTDIRTRRLITDCNLNMELGLNEMSVLTLYINRVKIDISFRPSSIFKLQSVISLRMSVLTVLTEFCILKRLIIAILCTLLFCLSH